jgi:hypothetical protein
MLFNQQNFKDLSKVYSKDMPCVSIFIPTHRAGHVQEDKIRFKNALAGVKHNLQNDDLFVGGGLIERQAEGFLTPVYDLLDDHDFWMHLSDGLAVFIGKDRFEHYRVPIDLNPLTYVKHHFYLRPLMPLLNGEDRFFVLALSQGGVRFFEGHAYSITPVKINDLVPGGLEEALALEDPEKSLQVRNTGPQQAFMFHGHGIHKDQQDWQIEQYCRMVDDGLMKMLHDENAPMIVLATDELAGVYRRVSNYSNVMDFHVSGNPENYGPALVHEKAWDKMKTHFRSNLERQKELFGEALAKDRASASIHDVVPAAVIGRVQTLFLAKDAPVLWGFYNEADNSITIHEDQRPYSICLHDLAAVQTFEQGGVVYHIDRMDFPQVTSQVNAIYRY